jgi:hypothetical protein
MNTQTHPKYQNTAVKASVSETADSFNFDLWASAVKQQMIASLRKRHSNSN